MAPSGAANWLARIFVKRKGGVFWSLGKPHHPEGLELYYRVRLGPELYYQVPGTLLPKMILKLF